MSPASVPPLAGGGRKVTARVPDDSGIGADADVAKPRVVLLVAGRADRLTAVGN